MSTKTGRKLPPDPLTVAEMIPVREAEIAARKAPRCHVKYQHGLMVPRPLAGQSYEQMYVGVHYDCKRPDCSSSCCWSSRELAAYHGEPYVVDADHAEMWDGEAWQPITRERFDSHWADRKAREERSRADMAAAAERRRHEQRQAREAGVRSPDTSASVNQAGHVHQHDTNGNRYRCPVSGCWWTATGAQAQDADVT